MCLTHSFFDRVVCVLHEQVIVAASERCLDVTPLEPPILDKLIQAKLAKSKEHNNNTASS